MMHQFDMLVRDKMDALPVATLMEDSEWQPRNADNPILLTAAGILMLLRAEQPRNAAEPIEVRLAGRLTPVSEIHPEKAALPIEVTEREMPTLASETQP